MRSAAPTGMRVRLPSNLIAAVLAPALLASGTSQGLVLMRCGSTVRMSCCCPKEAPRAAFSTLTKGVLHSCDKIIVASVPAQNFERVIPIGSAPILVATPGPLTSVGSVAEHLWQAPRLDSRPGPSLVLANCALLI